MINEDGLTKQEVLQQIAEWGDRNIAHAIQVKEEIYQELGITDENLRNY